MIVSAPINNSQFSYEDTLDIAANRGLTYINFGRTKYVGDKVSDDHRYRVYLEVLPW